MLDILETGEQQAKERITKLLNRSSFDNPEQVSAVEDIWFDVKKKGDEAVFHYTEKFDGFQLTEDNIVVSGEEIEAAYDKVDNDFLDAIRKSIDNVADFHYKQMREGWFEAKEDGVFLGQKFEPLNRVGIYVPGGRAPYPSSVVMNAVPASVAQVNEIVMVSPPAADGSLNPYTLVTAAEAGVDLIYKVGGAQAIAGLSLGTESMKTVDKIVGPGNIYVTLAKKMAFGYVDIDMLAGPSEILVLADEQARADFVAADLLSQAEHDPMASSVLVTTSRELAKEVQTELDEQLKELSREEIARESLEKFGAIIVAEDLDEAIEVTNDFAAEHLEVKIADPFSALGKIKNAGAIFLGEYTVEAVGDYIAGPNHVLPTGGTAKFYSPLNIDDYLKKSSVIYYTKEGLNKIKDDAIKIADVEGLDAHANSIKIRFEE